MRSAAELRERLPADGFPAGHVVQHPIRPPQDTGRRAWRNRRKQIASLIRFHAPDVVGTQEGKLHQLIDLEERLRNYEWIGVGRRSGGDEFSALFYRTDRLTLLEHDTFWLSKTPNTPGSKSWGLLFLELPPGPGSETRRQGTPCSCSTRISITRARRRGSRVHG